MSDPVKLPPPNTSRPFVTRILSDALVPGEGKDAQGQPLPRDFPLIWATGEIHPLVPGGRIVRMYRDPDGAVEIYSVFDRDSKGMRNYIPPEKIRLVEEVMSIDLLEDEIAIAEESDDDTDPEEEHEPPEQSAETSPNGQQVAGQA